MTKKLNIKTWRIEAGMTQQDVADKLGVARQTVGDWESGNKVLSGVVIYALAKLYGTEVDFIKV
ncbi:helix-turn-helix transcriptional regulator [Abyssicoccus albus]|uniref:helix-turn-helix transcriptional regulator n=1 Tax=Abyssicoccus albus TaxID=1817405 RepID=UPI00097E2934|nr:helix-turn-helix transcriptional regulator [Abyssicoccus albus]AQL56442.1 transcriptional regulator [Abyssicoccus albus]